MNGEEEVGNFITWKNILNRFVKLGQLFSYRFEALTGHWGPSLPVSKLLIESSVHHLDHLLVKLSQVLLVVLGGVVEVPGQCGALFVG